MAIDRTCRVPQSVRPRTVDAVAFLGYRHLPFGAVFYRPETLTTLNVISLPCVSHAYCLQNKTYVTQRLCLCCAPISPQINLPA
jgi:hypothetical protein